MQPGGLTLAELADASVSAQSLAALHAVDPSALTDEDRVAYLRLCARVEGFVAARRLRTVAALAGDGDAAADFVECEVAVATRTPVGAAVGEVHRARAAVRTLPRTVAGCESGDLHPAHLRRMLEATTSVTDPQLCAAVEARVLPRAVAQTPAQLGQSARRAVARLDPQAFQHAHQTARRHSDVWFTPVDAAMAYLTAYLPVSEAAAVMRSVESSARSAKAAGDQRPLGMLRGLALVTQVALGAAAEPRHTAHGRPVELQLVATVETMLGLAETPGELLGVGPVPATVVREMAAQAKMRWLTVDGRTGRLLDRSEHMYRPSARLAADVCATWVTSAAPGSTLPAGDVDLDHLIEYAAGGATSTANLLPEDRRWHRAKTARRVQVQRLPDGRVRWTTPLGQQVIVQPFDYRLGP